MMRKGVLLVAIVFIFFGCKKEVNEFPFDSFVFSSSNLSDINSLKFTKSDTIFLQRNFPEPKENFYAILRADQKIELNELLQTFNLEKFDSIYSQENLEDGQSYLFNINQKGKNKWVCIYGENAPKQLYSYANSLNEFKNKLKFTSIKQNVDFGDLKYILPPPPPIIN